MPLPTIPSGNVSSGLATGFNVANSVRFNRGDNSYMSRTFGTPTNRKKFTISFWLKRGNISISGGMALFGSDGGNTSTFGTIHFTPQDSLAIQAANGSSDILNLVTHRKFRDVGAWYHICVIFDTTQSTNTDRVKLYVNGTQETSFSSNTYPSQNDEFLLNQGSKVHSIGKFPYGADVLSIDGYICEFVFIDGTTTSITDFGEFDEDSPTIWKPIDVSGLTFGNNGCYLDFEDSGDLDDDESGNGNDFTATNVEATDQSTDTCTNNFCTMNPLDNYYAASTFSEGNCKIVTHAGNTTYNTSTFGLTAGRWYWEYKFTGTAQQWMTGIASKLSNATSDVLGYQHAEEYALNQSGSGIYSNSSTTAYGSGNLAVNDIISVALDLTNNNLYFAKNGQWGSGSAWDQTFSGALAYSITDPASTTLGAYFVAVGEWNGSNNSTINMNFGGSPSFTISSGNADANGYGNFEYAVPSGYYSLCTKNLSEYG